MSDGALVEYNISGRGCYELEGDLANAPLWAWDMANAVFQYNEVYDTIQTRDGMGFDIDGCCQNNVVQYNYFHDNNGGLLMIVGTPDCANNNYSAVRDPFCNDKIFRYNISQRDLTRVLRFVGKIWDNYVYNNTIYVGPDVDYTVESGKCGDIGPRKQGPLNTYLYNNIIYNVEDCGGQDYWVNTVPSGTGTDRGAHEYAGRAAGTGGGLLRQPEERASTADGQLHGPLSQRSHFVGLDLRRRRHLPSTAPEPRVRGREHLHGQPHGSERLRAGHRDQARLHHGDHRRR